ncbi:hypothetical protein [Micromonospora sp. NBRC 101691]|uniref:hypothetical protein n=1 Tax=Micromonospora sp. NBRC 101691 TaxID=3032198 RepID=UPI00249FE09F|nr:hypothetical protein [Micromonospora sp. NBRC 101691]GLY21702.1 hypothetical protein Misp04_14340 [Micromonospora sp. NBRC 101691]
MTRTVKVGLDVAEQPFVRGMDRAAGAAGRLEDALDDVTDSARETATGTERASESADDLGDSAREAARDLDRLRADAARLDAQIDDTARGIRDLAREIARTSDEAERAKLAEKLTVERGKLRQQVDLRKLIDVDSADGMGAELASQVSVSFAARLGPLLARAPMAGMNPAVAAIGAPLVAGLVTLLGAGVAGAIVGGVGVGGVIGGIKLAARDPAVKAAGTELGTDLAAVLGRSASAFVPETLSAIDTIRDRVRKLEPDLNRMFSGASRFVDPLVDGLLDAAGNALPGVIDVIESAGPVIDTVADGARDLGDALGDGLSGLADNADEAGRALDTLFFIMESGVRSAFILVEALTALYGAAEIVGAVLTGDVARFMSLVAAQKAGGQSSAELSGVIGELGTKMRDTGKETISAADAAKTLKSAFDELFGSAMDVDRAAIEYREGIKEMNAELREGKRSLDINTQAGRENTTAVLDQIDRIKALRDARLAQGQSIDVVDGKYRKEIGAIRAKLAALGYEKSEIDALLGKYEAIPDRVSTRVDAETKQAEANLAQVRSLIAQIKSKRVVITTQHNQIVTRSEGRNVPIGDVGGRRWGGIVEHAQWGTLREAQIAAPVAPARYAWAEPATGGEAFIPRFGDPGRSLDILSRAARWYGQAVVPAATQGRPQPTVDPAQIGAAVGAAVRSAVSGMAVVLDGRTVGYVQGRQADIYART